MKPTFHSSTSLVSPLCADQELSPQEISDLLLGSVSVPFSFPEASLWDREKGLWIYTLLKGHQSCCHKTVLLLWYWLVLQLWPIPCFRASVFPFIKRGCRCLKTASEECDGEKHGWFCFKCFEVSRWMIVPSFKRLVIKDTTLFYRCILLSKIRAQLTLLKKFTPPALLSNMTPIT